ncbi:MAG: hypothetical protein HOJ15_02190 [Candidatus Jacksonbacteria bacterium]|jgi:hypothetical protein|nr:hypothetical protein [Candidatus Jacksonbacteria bacterium]MBT6034777.1 hypothetical protein [Candidatus Jacksonbacteria bacterium]MBT6301215.1 hypothetical protein [Candidatus Jacksonbacteria bacterium]MBT6757035.1 hypothetical protein [Candidatus Jacksonbacteria bacterium]MBT6954818.1 hypothetical protein [Candidatus Jacksonbacteria bacterium]
MTTRREAGRSSFTQPPKPELGVRVLPEELSRAIYTNLKDEGPSLVAKLRWNNDTQTWVGVCDEMRARDGLVCFLNDGIAPTMGECIMITNHGGSVVMGRVIPMPRIHLPAFRGPFASVSQTEDLPGSFVYRATVLADELDENIDLLDSPQVETNRLMVIGLEVIDGYPHVHLRHDDPNEESDLDKLGVRPSRDEYFSVPTSLRNLRPGMSFFFTRDESLCPDLEEWQGAQVAEQAPRWFF